MSPMLRVRSLCSGRCLRLSLLIGLLTATAIVLNAPIASASPTLIDADVWSQRTQSHRRRSPDPVEITTNNQWVPAELPTITNHLTPEIFLSVPDRSALTVNAAGTYAVYSLSSYSFDTHSTTSEYRIFDIQRRLSKSFITSATVGSFRWIGDQIMYLDSQADGTKAIKITTIDAQINYTAGFVPASLTNVKVTAVAPGQFALVGVAQVSRNGSLYNSSSVTPPLSQGRLYDNVMPREWDHYLTPQQNAMFYGLLDCNSQSSQGASGQCSFSGLHNPLVGTALDFPSVTQEFTASEDFDVSANGIAFVTKEPIIDWAYNTKSNAYYVPIQDYAKAPTSKPIKLQPAGLFGAASAPVFSPQGNGLLFFQMRQNRFAADKRRPILVPDMTQPGNTVELLQTSDGQGAWDRSPSQALWTRDGCNLTFVAESNGQYALFRYRLPQGTNQPITLPEQLPTNGDISSIQHLTNSSDLLLTSGSTLVDSSVWRIVDPASNASPQLLSSATSNGSAFGLNSSTISSISWPGENGNVQAWVLKPSNFDPGQTYPLAMWIHGGPEEAWEGLWSGEESAAVFAEQGYVVVMPNPTGSTSFGQAYTNAIRGDWGGAPYRDLVAGMDYLAETAPYLDMKRAVALGGSYGGYMINWIQGHELGRRFRALVCIDGIFSTVGMLATDDVVALMWDVGQDQTYWDAPDVWHQWDPSRHVSNWSTPELIVHGDNDYRVPINEGIAAFSALRQRYVKSRLLTFPDEGHSITKPENMLVYYHVVLNWVNYFVGLPPVGDDPPISGKLPLI